MNVSPIMLAPMPAKAADTLAGAETGFGDLLSIAEPAAVAAPSAPASAAPALAAPPPPGGSAAPDGAPTGAPAPGKSPIDPANLAPRTLPAAPEQAADALASGASTTLKTPDETPVDVPDEAAPASAEVQVPIAAAPVVAAGPATPDAPPLKPAVPPGDHEEIVAQETLGQLASPAATELAVPPEMLVADAKDMPQHPVAGPQAAADKRKAAAIGPAVVTAAPAAVQGLASKEDPVAAVAVASADAGDKKKAVKDQASLAVETAKHADTTQPAPDVVAMMPVVLHPVAAPAPVPVADLRNVRATTLAERDAAAAGTTTAAATGTGTATSSATASVEAAPAAAAAQFQPGDDSNLPSLLASQTPIATAGRQMPPIQPYAAPAHVPEQPVVAARAGTIGRDMGVEIARQVSAGRDEMVVRLDPAQMGRVDIRLSFDDKGRLHAAVSADSPAALDMLRRDVGDLGRALSDAGIRADTSSFRFDSRGGEAGQSAQQQQQHGRHGGDAHDGRGNGRRGRDDSDFAGTDTSPYRQLRTSGRVDLMA